MFVDCSLLTNDLGFRRSDGAFKVPPLGRCFRRIWATSTAGGKPVLATPDEPAFACACMSKELIVLASHSTPSPAPRVSRPPSHISAMSSRALSTIRRGLADPRPLRHKQRRSRPSIANLEFSPTVRLCVVSVLVASPLPSGAHRATCPDIARNLKVARGSSTTPLTTSCPNFLRPPL